MSAGQTATRGPVAAPCVLLVDDDRRILELLEIAFTAHGFRVLTAPDGDAAMKRALAERPDLVVLDVRLPDGDAFTVLDYARKLAPAPIQIALSGAASPEDAFRLAQYGVRSFLQKPVSLGDIWDAIQSAVEEPPDIAPHVQQAVGHLSLRELTSQVRDEAIKEALASARGNRTGAARILQVTRQAVQQMLRPPAKH